MSMRMFPRYASRQTASAAAAASARRRRTAIDAEDDGAGKERETDDAGLAERLQREVVRLRRRSRRTRRGAGGARARTTPRLFHRSARRSNIAHAWPHQSSRSSELPQPKRAAPCVQCAPAALALVAPLGSALRRQRPRHTRRRRRRRAQASRAGGARARPRAGKPARNDERRRVAATTTASRNSRPSCARDECGCPSSLTPCNASEMPNTATAAPPPTHERAQAPRAAARSSAQPCGGCDDARSRIAAARVREQHRQHAAEDEQRAVEATLAPRARGRARARSRRAARARSRSQPASAGAQAARSPDRATGSPSRAARTRSRARAALRAPTAVARVARGHERRDEQAERRGTRDTRARG